MLKFLEDLKIILLGILSVIYLLFSSCTGMPEPFHQEVADISKIELINHTYPSKPISRTFSSQDDIEHLMKDLCKLRCFKRNSPVTDMSDYGIYEIRIYYTDYAEYLVYIIGSDSNGIIHHGKEEYNYGTYFYKDEDLEELFEHYSVS